MLPLTTHAHDFEGAPLLTFILDDRPCWVARHIGARLGYSHGGKRLPNKILGDWAEEFIEGHDYRLLEGAELAAFRASLGKVDGVPGRGSLLVLFEPGLYLVLAKTELPVGKRLRRFLVDEVLPALARTGTYTVESPEPEEAPAEAPALSLPERREARLLLQAQVRDAWVSIGSTPTCSRSRPPWAWCSTRCCTSATSGSGPTPRASTAPLASTTARATSRGGGPSAGPRPGRRCSSRGTTRTSPGSKRAMPTR